jgi:hypothetical protein
VIVYGDRVSRRDVRESFDGIQRALEQIEAIGPGEQRHGAAVGALLAAGELAQALADGSFEETGRDGPDARADAAMRLAVALAGLVWSSHRSAWRDIGATGEAHAALAPLARLDLPRTLAVRSTEGFEHYALYPETYAEAAAAAGNGFAPVIVAIRTIGTTLGAMVAAGCGADAVPLTVRPVGHPFQRRLALSRATSRALRRDRHRTFAVVDEGPGLSGSSFAAALDALDDAGVPLDNVHVFPSHLGPAPLASAATRRLWSRVTKHCRPFEATFLGDGANGLQRWTEALTGPQIAPPEDIGGGRWRARHFASAEQWPPAHVGQERRKYLLRTRDGTFVARFAGIGRSGERRLARARRLADGGFGAPVLGLRHGFLVERWLERGRPLAAAAASVARSRVVGQVGRYLAFRARDAASTHDQGGATAGQLLDMAIANATEELGDRGRALEAFAGWLAALQSAARPVAIDGRLHAWEWLVLPDQRLMKTDAVDHCEAHDLIGAQDIAWDVAGAAVELGLAPDEIDVVRGTLRDAHVELPPEALAFYRACYLAFQLGYYRMAAQAMRGAADESARLDAAAARYGALLDRICAGDPRAVAGVRS